MTAGKTIALTRGNFVGKIMSLLFGMLPSLVISFLPRSKVSYSHIIAKQEARKFLFFLKLV